MDKRILAVALAIILLPIVIALWPHPISYTRFRDNLEGYGLVIKNAKSIGKPAHGALEEVRFTANGAAVQMFRFDDAAKMETCYQLYRDPTRARENLARLLAEGFTIDLRAPTVAARNQWYVITVTTDNDSLRDTILGIFRRL